MTGEFSLSVLRPGSYEEKVPFSDDGTATAWAIKARLINNGEHLKLSLSGDGKAVVTLWLNPEFTDPFPLIPGFMLGYNRPEDTGPYYPQMTDVMDLNLPNMRSPYWGIRSDRATAPVVFIFGREGMRALSVPPYMDNPEGNYTTTGIRVCKKRGIGISIGFIVEPVQFIHNGTYAPAYREYHDFKKPLEVNLGPYISTLPQPSLTGPGAPHYLNHHSP
ncbi:MAG: hypothetical protein L0922_07755, partial [Candidatus Mariimomonas ferrooxydans]